MAIDGEGIIYIPLEDFWAWVMENYAPYPEGAESLVGKPEIDILNVEIKIPYAFSTICNPTSWGKKSKAELSWKEAPHSTAEPEDSKI